MFVDAADGAKRQVFFWVGNRHHVSAFAELVVRAGDFHQFEAVLFKELDKFAAVGFQVLPSVYTYLYTHKRGRSRGCAHLFAHSWGGNLPGAAEAADIDVTPIEAIARQMEAEKESAA